MAIPTYAGEASDVFISEHKNIEGVYTDKKTSQLRSTFSFSIEKFSRAGKRFCKLTEKGEGDYDKYENVSWESKVEAEEDEDLLHIVYSVQIIRDKDGNTIVEHKKHFDYVLIDEELCNGCVLCMKACPTKAIRVEENRVARIQGVCIDCGECVKVCPRGAVKPIFIQIDKIEEYYLNELMKTHDANEGLKAFVEKRAPEWKNQ